MRDLAPAHETSLRQLQTASCGEPLPDLIRIPAWEQYPWLCAGFSYRSRGHSHVYGSGELNVGWTKEDDPALVQQNRRSFLQALSPQLPMELVTLQQVHGSTIRGADGMARPSMTSEGKATLEGDGLISSHPGRAVGVITADCVPVLLLDAQHRVVAAFHAGWRGTLAGIVEQGVGRIRERTGSRPETLSAAIGPAIRSCCFAVGDEVQSLFEHAYPYASALFHPVPVLALEATGGTPAGTSLHMDLQKANRQQLLHAGLQPHDIHVIAECTACARLPDTRRKYFSHRAERGVTGRMLSAIGILPG